MCKKVSQYARRRKAWEYPDCENCHTPVMVHKTTNQTNLIGDETRYKCQACKGVFVNDEYVSA